MQLRSKSHDKTELLAITTRKLRTNQEAAKAKKEEALQNEKVNIESKPRRSLRLAQASTSTQSIVQRTANKAQDKSMPQPIMKNGEDLNEVQVIKKRKIGKSKEGSIEYIEENKLTEERSERQVKEAKLVKTISRTIPRENLLTREFYTRDATIVARELLGKIIVRKMRDKVIRCRIVETEAYAGAIDKASHSYGNKQTERTKHCFKEGGHLYVYSIYGNNFCMNITASKEGDPSTTFIRAVEIIEGLEYAKENRYVKKLSESAKELTNGPGKLCGALKIDKSFNGHDVTKMGELYLVDDSAQFEMVTTKRVNIDYAQEFIHKPWRFCIKNNIYVSVKLNPVNPESC